ncbi:hypothetical protein KTQ42_15675|uniref:hypothetical protein n=1 Tax=Noviherbaspirillum sp. L7-7A TaxID=2850560 RepID=UPI001C2C72E9|nr:hypothetical protein [Noviherbaspirillum sp. L7-7A]MBV0880741.1 hypothetical protein [Noviherbaspirillum sp. L7-7A]
MKRSDDVFFFTLIDFLLQVFFFGLVLYVVADSLQSELKAEREKKEEQVKKIINATGVSNLVELTDILTNLAPIKELKGTADFIDKAGGIEKVMAAVNVAQQAGGAENISPKLDELRKLKEGFGKPPCLFSAVGDKKVPKPLATVVATDTSISFLGNSQDLEDVLKLVGRSYDSVRELPTAEFRKVFAPLLVAKPDCRYSLRFRENTRLVYARDAARFSFYLNIEAAK